MPQVMTTRAIVLCPHGGQGASTPMSPKWSVEGGIVLRENDTGVIACPFLPPCVGYTLRSMGLNATKVDGAAAILVTDFNQTYTGLPLSITEAHRTIDNSTPAPVPPGQGPPPLSPELLDAVPPVVTPVPPALAFNSITMQPASLVATFTLSTPFPLKWVLTRISEPPLATSADVTNGEPAGAVVAPAAGAWNSPALTVTLTMSALYVAGLGPGRHHFYMTGVSKRGLSSWAESILTVS
jgi:hypothetical protein